LLRKSGVRRAKGFTLLELAVTIAIVGILAAMAYGISRAAVRNATLGSIAFDLSARLGGLKYSAITEQRDYLFVVLDAPDATACGVTSPSSCGRWFLLRNPQSFTITGFDPDHPGAHAEVVDRGELPQHVKFHPSPPGSPPPPFGSVPLFNSELTATVGGIRRFGIRFAGDGSVTGEKAGSASGPWPGYAFVLTTDQYGDTRAADRKGVVVAFPAGIVRTFSVQ
jgi:prepilin-type N-terminal cleavage/methylation domain-containing protein